MKEQPIPADAQSDAPLAIPGKDRHPGLKWLLWLMASLFLLVILAMLALAAMPLSFARPFVERRLGAIIGAPVSIGAIERQEWFSFSPHIVLRDIRIRQPAWAGQGDLLRAQTLQLRLPLLPLLGGNSPQPTEIRSDHVSVDLVRTKTGQVNWKAERNEPSNSKGGPNGFTDVMITNGRFALRDEKRQLALTGDFSSIPQKGLRVAGAGRYHDAAATVLLTGGAIAGLAPNAPYPVRFSLKSSVLTLEAQGETKGALDLGQMRLDIRAKAPSLKYLDYFIEAGLFGTKAIDLEAQVDHDGRDWFIRRISGTVGRSRMVGRADVLKRDERTKIDATIRFSQFDFDDLSDAQGQARQEATRARIGKRVIPATRINLSKVGPTDGIIHFRADRLLLGPDSAFRSLAGDIRLDHKHLALEKMVAGMSSGRMVGRLDVVQNGAKPRLTADLLFENGRLGQLLGAPDKIDAPFRARVVLSGHGDTIREAISVADGHAGLLARNGQVSRLAAAVIGQDLGKSIGAALGKSSTVPLRCAAVGFEARGGLLSATPFVVDTDISVARGTGTINMRDEAIDLTIGGAARQSSGIPIVDPVRIGGTLTAPEVRLGRIGSKPPEMGTVIGLFGKSLGAALGLTHKKGPEVASTASADCAALERRIIDRR